MTNPQRLIEAADDFERDLIRSAHADAPSQRALEHLLLGLGVELSQLPSSMASSAPLATTSGKLGGAVLAKCFLTGLTLGLATIGGAQVVSEMLEHRGPRAVEAPQSSVQRSPTLAAPPYIVSPAAPWESARRTPEIAPSASLPGARPRQVAGATLDTRAAAKPAADPPATEPTANAAATKTPGIGAFELEAVKAPSSTLAQETRLLDAARQALARGDSHSALSRLESYERTFPNPALAPEASVLKVRALLTAGDRAGAEALGQRVIERAPHSEHAAAVRAALGIRSKP